MELNNYIPVLVQIGLALTLAVIIISASHLLGQRARTNKVKDSAYECGLPSDGKSGARFSIKFYLTAMLFILFDIEVVFLIPWVLVFRDFLQMGIPILMPVLFFIGLLTAGLVYEIKKGALDWDK
ncbi:MAG: NADH-quinone oxidoreductase subunit A [Opitutales bacterium]|nr:NADH-quinone oxidoreductase subunit A [Opitutales bacterium]